MYYILRGGAWRRQRTSTLNWRSAPFSKRLWTSSTKSSRSSSSSKCSSRSARTASASTLRTRGGAVVCLHSAPRCRAATQHCMTSGGAVVCLHPAPLSVCASTLRTRGVGSTSSLLLYVFCVALIVNSPLFTEQIVNHKMSGIPSRNVSILVHSKLVTIRLSMLFCHRTCFFKSPVFKSWRSSLF